mgnify:CR=1 FL=1
METPDKQEEGEPITANLEQAGVELLMKSCLLTVALLESMLRPLCMAGGEPEAVKEEVPAPFWLHVD